MNLSGVPKMRQKQTKCGAFAADRPACSELRHRQTSTNRPKKRSFQQPANTKAFKSKALDTDDKFTFTFATPGIYEYFCSLHPHMTGTVVVESGKTSGTNQ
jgi:plastocyanin